MLLNTNRIVSEISLALGYENTETFIRLIRLIRRELNITPAHYREQRRNDTPKT